MWSGKNYYLIWACLVVFYVPQWWWRNSRFSLKKAKKVKEVLDQLNHMSFCCCGLTVHTDVFISADLRQLWGKKKKKLELCNFMFMLSQKECRIWYSCILTQRFTLSWLRLCWKTAGEAFGTRAPQDAGHPVAFRFKNHLTCFVLL